MSRLRCLATAVKPIRANSSRSGPGSGAANSTNSNPSMPIGLAKVVGWNPTSGCALMARTRLRKLDRDCNAAALGSDARFAAMPGEPIETLVRHVRDALARGDAARAEALCRECVELDPAREDALAFLATRAVERGDAAAVRALLARATELKPSAALLHFHHGCVLESLGSPGEARDAYAAALAADPQMLLARFWLGAAESALGEDEAALGTWVRAMAEAERTGFARELAHQPPAARRRIDEAVAAVRAGRHAAIEDAIGTRAPSARVRAAFARYVGRAAHDANHPAQRPSFLLIPGLPG